MIYINAVTVHDCSKCKLHKVIVGDKKVDEKDYAVYNAIQTRESDALQAIRSDSLDNIIDTLSFEEQVDYFEKAFAAHDEAVMLLIEWWELMKKKYNFSESTKIDYISRSFFECVDDNGVPDMIGHLIPKDGVDLNTL